MLRPPDGPRPVANYREAFVRRHLTCPKCGTEFRPDVGSVQSSYDAYLAVEVRGMSSAAYAASRNLAKSSVTLLRRCGKALAEVGIDADSVLFKQLCNNAAAVIAEVGREIERPGATPDSVEAVLRKYWRPDGERIR